MSGEQTTGGLTPGRHVLTVAVEDYFQVAAFHGAVERRHWKRFEPRLAACLDLTLELLRQHGVRATFFVLGWVAERQPELVRRIANAGHELASRGYWPRSIDGISRQELRDDLRRTRVALEAAGANPILGHRFGSWLGERDLWVLELLAEEGYRYDASINPLLRRSPLQRISTEAARYRVPGRDLSIWEFPVSCLSLGPLRLPICGGNYTRQLPFPVQRALVDRWMRTREAPLVYYFMPWELDAEQPQVTAISRLNQLRQYRNLDKARWALEDYLSRFHFGPIGDALGIDYRKQRRDMQRRAAKVRARSAPLPEVRGPHEPPEPSPPPRPRRSVSLVIPLYNELSNVPYMATTLARVRADLAEQYRVHLVLVDDGSSDGTYEALRARLVHTPDCQLERHLKNRGVAAALMTGIQRAPTEVVCSIDCDLSYDPGVLAQMIPLIEEAEMVTASPYHPDGKVKNVPGWRLFLSHNLSRLYSRTLGGHRLFTYTSCCRVVRRSALAHMALAHDGFLGVAEMLICVKMRGGRVVEHPATLESRMFGVSKMKTARTIRGHLGILNHLARGGCPGGLKLDECPGGWSLECEACKAPSGEPWPRPLWSEA